MEEQLDYTDARDREISLIKKDGKISEIITSLFREPYKINDNSLRFGVLGDLHGHITLGLNKLKEWQEYSGLELDAILQVGDFGVYDEQSNLDQVTLEMSEKDPDELGFKNYHNQSEEADYFFKKGNVFSKINLYFIGGNHDDLSVFERNPQISFYENLKYIPNGHKETVKKRNLKINIGALGDKYTKSDIRKLSTEKIDILLSHDPPKSYLNPQGDEKLEKFIENYNVNYNFFGHLHEGAVNFTLPIQNQYGLNEVRLKKNKLKRGSIGFLEISESDSIFWHIPED